MKAHQAAKISELGEALACTGHLHLDDQARVLGLPRSTTWTILHSTHKNYGLSAAVINQMLAQPQLPPLVRMKIVEYVDEKCAGMYGHNAMALRHFSAALTDIVPKRRNPSYRNGHGRTWLKTENPASPAAKRIEDRTF